MKSKIRLLVIGWYLVNCCPFGGAQSSSYRVSTAREFIEDGLGHNPLYQRFKDSRGVIWLVREKGLECFDGQRFKQADHAELKGAVALHILLEDADHDLWVRRDDQKIFFLQIYSGQLRGISEKFGATFPATVNAAIPGAKNTFLLQVESDKIVRYKPGYPPEPYYSAPEKIITPIVELSNGTVWIDCNNKGKGGDLIALDAQRRPKQILHYFSNYLHSRGLWGENAFYYVTADSFFVMNESTILEQKSLAEMDLYYHNEGASAITNWHFWYWIFTPLATILFYSIFRYRKKQMTRKAQTARPEIAKGREVPIDMANEILSPGMLPENEYSEGQQDRNRPLPCSNQEEMQRRETADESDMDSGMEVNDLEFLYKVQGIILDQLDNSELDGKLLSKMTGLSHSQLHRKLTALTGLPTGRYIHHIRLQEAKRLLAQKDLNIADIAYMTGFSDPAYFTRLFTKTFGGSPRSFRH